MSKPFLKPKYEGVRFSGKRLPVDVLRDLPLFQELILHTARWLFLQENRERKRLPRSWAAGFRLVLTDIEDGSAIPVLELDTDDIDSDFSKHFAAARDRVITAVNLAGDFHGPDIGLPPNVLDIFDRLGSNLRGDERIVLSRPDGLLSAILDQRTRRNLASRAKTKSYEQAVELIGTLPELDQQRMTFELMQADGKRLKCQYDSIVADQVLLASQAYQEECPFQLSGVGLFSPNGDLQRVLETHFLEEWSAYEMLPGFKNLSKLEPGWYDGEQGLVPTPEDLRWLCDQWIDKREESCLIKPREIPAPNFSLSVEGEVHIEWLLKPWDVSLDIDTAEKTGVLHAFNLDTDDVRYDEALNLRTEEGWERLELCLNNVFAGAVK